MDFWLEIQKTKIGIRICILEIPWLPISRQKGQLWLFGSKFAQKWILGSEFQKSKSGLRISTSKLQCEPVFSQSGQLWSGQIFLPKFGEIVQLSVIFWFEYCWGCCRELGGGWNELGGGRWSWVELGEGRWSWVELGARFSNTLLRNEGDPSNGEMILKWGVSMIQLQVSADNSFNR